MAENLMELADYKINQILAQMQSSEVDNNKYVV